MFDASRIVKDRVDTSDLIERLRGMKRVEWFRNQTIDWIDKEASFSEILFLHGFCFTFNLIDFEEMFNSEVYANICSMQRKIH